jgi:hypothetical protein
MPSITYWNRVEARPRSSSIREALAAQVRDPLWFLTRQWQLGEFRGEDAASPAYLQYRARFSDVDAYRAGPPGSAAVPYAGGAPLESLVESESFTPDLATSVELGRAFERLLAAGGLGPEVIDAFRSAYAIPTPEEADEMTRLDPATARFLAICGGRSVDGGALCRAAIAAAPALPAEPALDASVENAALAAVDALVALARRRYGRIGTEDAIAWNAERLAYDTEIFATTPGGDRVGLRGSPGVHGEFDWFAFDETGEDDGAIADASTVRHVSASLLPGRLAFSGLPQVRYWAFESARFNFADVHPDRREIGKLLLLDFMLVSSHDWFQIPFRQRVGSLVRVDALFVHDVFGGVTAVERADVARGRQGWSMFSTAIEGAPDELADYFLLPPSAGSMNTPGMNVEEVRYFRDETANLVWAVEHAVESPIAHAWPGRERSQLLPAPPPQTPSTQAELVYRLHTDVPAHWIPFVPVQIDAARRAVALERAAMTRETPDGFVAVAPTGRVLRPSALVDPAVYRVREEEITRTGLRVIREVRQSRWTDGSAHLWIARARRSGAGEGQSGLRFDTTRVDAPPRKA